MNCLAHIVKYILYIFNVLFLICGVLLIIFGALTISSIKDFLSFTEASSTKTIPVCILILGCVVFIVSFLGCCGAIKENKCLIYSYSICMLIIFGLQIALIIYTWAYRKEFLKNMGEVVDKAWDSYNEEKKYMDALQMSFKCCGKMGSPDYTGPGLSIPNSCCGSLTAVCDADVASKLPGCREAFVDFWSSNTNIIKYVGLVFAAVELTALIFGCFLSSSIRNKHVV